MDSEEEVLVRSCADDICCEEERKGQNWRNSKAYCAGQLYCYDA